MGEVDSAKTAISSNSTMSLASTQASSPAKPVRPAWLYTSFSESTTSSSRKICRICQMHEGDMVKPCDCTGTMGDVHEECLTKWVNMSNKKKCEICNSEYAQSGAHFKPLREWSRPKLSMRVCTHVLIVFVLASLTSYIVVIMEERRFYERVIAQNMFSRPDDNGRIAIILILGIAILNNFYTVLCLAIRYLKSQRQIRFINKH